MPKHRSHGSDDSGVQLGLIITPMLDMSFQIMAFFIMTYHPSALEGHIDGNLLPPEKSAVKSKDQKQTDPNVIPADIDPELNEVLLVQIKAVAKKADEQGGEQGRNEGEPKQLLLKLPAEPDPKEIANATVEFKVGLKRLEDELKQYLKNGAMGNANIKLEGDNNLKHMYTMEVYDVCKLAGFKNISFVAPPIERGPPKQQ